MAFRLQRPVFCRTPISENTQFGIMPVLGLSPRSSLRFQEVKISATTRMLASAGYSKRRQRRSLIPKTKTSIPKGFTPRSRSRTSIRKKDQNDTEEKENSGNLSFSDPTLSNSGLTDKIVPSEVQTTEIDSSAEMLIMLGDKLKKGSDMLEALEQQGLVPDEQNFTGVPSADTNGGQFTGQIADIWNEGDGPVLRSPRVTIDHNEKEIRKDLMTDKVSDLERKIAYVKDHIGRLSIAEKASIVSENEERPAAVECKLDTRNVVQPAKARELTENTVIDSEESLLKQKMDMNAHAQRLLENLADDMFARGQKVFVVSKLVTPKNSFRVFFNRSLSVLANEPDVIIKGAYNGWRRNFFTKKLQKTDLRGDWWSCQLPLPMEAFIVDFVFYNGANTYENNSSKHFSFILECGTDEAEYEDFLLEEKHNDLEKLAAKQAEKERQVEEQQRKEEEKAAREADKSQAKVDVEKRRHGLHIAKKLAQSSHHLWKIEPSLFKGGDKVRVYYNRSFGPLAHSTEIWIHGSHNNWSEGLSIIKRLFHYEKTDGDWWFSDVVVPDQALVLDWVFADGPPEKAIVYDNNNLQDFHGIVPTSVPEKHFWLEEENRIYRKLQEDRKSKEEAIHKKAEKTARMKAETKERTMKMFLLSQKHIVYTDPVDVQAGSVVNVFYNPYNTVLNGKREVWFRCSFNRWSHHKGPLPPQKMVPTKNGSHLKATVKVPMDAYMMDFVFSEKEDGGIYDNKNEMDYHIPVKGGIVKEPPMHIIHVSSEMAPIAKVGGLGDVVTSISRAIQELGHKVDIILPKYNCMNLNDVKYLHYRSSFDWGGTEIKVWFGKVEGLSVNFLEPQNGMFSVGCIYGRNNDAHRFGFFCHAALEFLLQSGYRPDILHCHDWTSAPVAWLFKEHYSQCALHNTRVIFTIHNLEFGLHHIARAMKFADKATTVSPTYSREVAGNPIISPYLHKFYGIVNGIDPDIWDPYNDQFIPVSYTAENVVEGKKAAKEALQQRLGLRISDHPLVGVITRLTIQKGVHLIKHSISRTLERNGQVVLLGSSPDPRIQNDFTNLANQLHSSHGDRVRFCLTYDEPLSHLIYAGADFILVPSIFEPCGLTQLTAMRYGSIPVVRKTGGLYDTVFDVDNDKERAQAQGLEPNGFCFEGADADGLDYALNRAISAWFDAREWFNSLCKRVMRQDWSWNRPALDYIELYHSARK